MEKLNLLTVIDHIDPSALDYSDWARVGMALKHEGYTLADWDTWSKRDPARYHEGETLKKWDSFEENTTTPVTGGTLVRLAKDQGYQFTSFDGGHALDWNDTINNDDLVVVDQNWIEEKEIKTPEHFDPVQEIINYISTLFEPNEKVGYVVDSYEKDGKHIPASKGSWSRTASELIDELNKCQGDIGAVLGDYDKNAGAWIRFNPLDGNGVSNNNVVAYRYALVESDDMSLEKQNAMLRELELPIATLVYSGAKSLHAIVKVNATTYDEYRKRVDYLYDVCAKNGLTVDTQDRNPSRLSRLPGVLRNGKKQFIMATNIGKRNWEEWEDWIESVNDDLPDPEPLTDTFNHLPPLAPALINNILRQGHKMLIAGPSKAGKSFALIELVIAIAEGKKWLQKWQCAQGKVLYVNLELDRASALHRFKNVYETLGYTPDHINNIDVWNLRGHSVPMDKLAPKLIRRAAKSNYIAIIIDPIYKVLTGDENSADQMAHFTNQFDKIATELGCAVIYCHHHSKGAQGGKRAMDRASGSGVFARDPDALLDLVELDINDSMLKQQRDRAECATYGYVIDKYNHEYYMREVGPDDRLSVSQMKQHAKLGVPVENQPELRELLTQTDKVIDNMTAWRIDGTLREFPRFKPINVWFKYPIHKLDSVGVLSDLEPDGEQPSWKKAMGSRKTSAQRKRDRLKALDTAYQAVGIDEIVTLKDIAEYMGLSEKTIKRRVKEHPDFTFDGTTVFKKTNSKRKK